ncbi:unnamed protein product, partial [Phaeothamnion confervicola]
SSDGERRARRRAAAHRRRRWRKRRLRQQRLRLASRPASATICRTASGRALRRWPASGWTWRRTGGPGRRRPACGPAGDERLPRSLLSFREQGGRTRNGRPLRRRAAACLLAF